MPERYERLADKVRREHDAVERHFVNLKASRSPWARLWFKLRLRLARTKLERAKNRAGARRGKRQT